MEYSTGVDLISSLCDDLLLNVLGHLPSAADVVRTSTLSRRWCRLWTRAPTLRFTVAIPDEYDLPVVDAPRMIGLIDAVLARRPAGTDMDNLEMTFLYRCRNNRYYDGFPDFGYSLEHPHAADVKATQVAAWLRYGARHAVKSFLLEVPAPPRSQDLFQLIEPPVTPPDEDDEVPLELPGSWRAEAVSLAMANRRLKLPTEGPTFHALTDLQLANVWIDAVRDRRRSLGRLVSSPCCPRLRRLSLKQVGGIMELMLHSGTLEVLEIFAAYRLLWLDVDAPSLRVLEVEECHYLNWGNAEMVIATPNLEVLACADVCNLEKLQFDDAPYVRRIEKLRLHTHGETDLQPAASHNGSRMWLLKKCTNVNHLGLSLSLPDLEDGSDYKDDMGDLPKLANVTTLDVQVPLYDGHQYGASLAELLAMCPRLEYLHIETKIIPRMDESPMKPECSDPACVCHGPASWESREIPVEHLREVEITGVIGWENEISFVKLRFASAAAMALQRMTVKFESCQEERGRKVSELAADLSGSAAGSGRWIPQADGLTVSVWKMN